MEQLTSSTYLTRAIKNIIFLIVFWLAFFCFMKHFHGTPNLWTIEQVWDTLSGVSFFGIVIVLLAIGFGCGGFLGFLIIGVGGSLLMAFLCNKIAPLLNIPVSQSDQLMGIVGILINVAIIIRLIMSIRNYKLLRYNETSNNSSEE